MWVDKQQQRGAGAVAMGDVLRRRSRATLTKCAFHYTPAPVSPELVFNMLLQRLRRDNVVRASSKPVQGSRAVHRGVNTALDV